MRDYWRISSAHTFILIKREIPFVASIIQHVKSSIVSEVDFI